MKSYLGVDPGFKSGAICIVSDDFKEIQFIDINDNLIGLIDAMKKIPKISFAILEQVHASPRQGVVSAFNFGRGYGWIEAILTFLEIPFEKVVPQKWMPVITTVAYREETPEESEAKEKERVRGRNKISIKKNTFNFCKGLFPAAELTSFSKESNRADALGIAYYCWHNYRSV